MKAIWKYEMHILEEFTIEMPVGAEVLSVQVQDGLPYIWALVEPENERASRMFSLRGTGHPAGDLCGVKFIGTFQMRGGMLVFHLFDSGWDVEP